MYSDDVISSHRTTSTLCLGRYVVDAKDPNRFNLLNGRYHLQHLYYSFAYIDSSKFTITPMNNGDEDYWAEFTALKKKKSTLKTYLSIGGWDLGGEVFSNLCRFPGKRSAFIKSALSVMEKYGFDGIDIDWEYPAAKDRGT